MPTAVRVYRPGPYIPLCLNADGVPFGVTMFLFPAATVPIDRTLTCFIRCRHPWGIRIWPTVIPLGISDNTNTYDGNVPHTECQCKLTV